MLNENKDDDVEEKARVSVEVAGQLIPHGDV